MLYMEAFQFDAAVIALSFGEFNFPHVCIHFTLDPSRERKQFHYILIRSKRLCLP